MKKILAIGLIVICLLMISSCQYNDAVNTCINNGTNRNTCEKGLK